MIFAFNKKALDNSLPHIGGEDDVSSGSRPFCCIWLSFDCIVRLDWPIEPEDLCPRVVDPVFSGVGVDVVDIESDELVVDVCGLGS